MQLSMTRPSPVTLFYGVIGCAGANGAFYGNTVFKPTRRLRPFCEASNGLSVRKAIKLLFIWL